IDEASGESWKVPQVFVMTDGHSNDDWQLGAAAVRNSRARVTGVAVGPHADQAVLGEFSNQVAAVPDSSHQTMSQLFDWFGGIIRVAATGEGRLPTPPRSAQVYAGAKQNKEPDSERDQEP